MDEEALPPMKYEAGMRVRVTSFEWNGIYCGKIEEVHENTRTYHIIYEDDTEDEHVEEEHVLDYVAKWNVNDEVVVIMDDWEDNFFGVITATNDMENTAEQVYSVYFEEDGTTEDAVQYHNIVQLVGK